MSDRMTIAEELREQERRLDRDVERIMEASPRCERHGTHFVLAIGIGEELFCLGPQGGCPTCFWEERNARP